MTFAFGMAIFRSQRLAKSERLPRMLPLKSRITAVVIARHAATLMFGILALGAAPPALAIGPTPAPTPYVTSDPQMKEQVHFYRGGQIVDDQTITVSFEPNKTVGYFFSAKAGIVPVAPIPGLVADADTRFWWVGPGANDFASTSVIDACFPMSPVSMSPQAGTPVNGGDLPLTITATITFSDDSLYGTGFVPCPFNDGGSQDSGASRTVTVVITECAKPVNFRKVRSLGLSDGTLIFGYAWDSSSGNLGDLSNCVMRENVVYPGGNPYVPPRPPFVASYPNPTTNPWPATDGIVVDAHQPPGFIGPYSPSSYSASQVYEFQTPCTPQNQFEPLATYSITRSVSMIAVVCDPSGYIYIVEKDGAQGSTCVP